MYMNVQKWLKVSKVSIVWYFYTLFLCYSNNITTPYDFVVIIL